MLNLLNEKGKILMPKPLRYKISDWRQLSRCKSNMSKDLSISVTTFVQDDRLNGERIAINHTDFGTLFACVLNAKGTMVCKSSNDDYTFEFTPAQILEELRKYGFLVDYNPVESIDGSQLFTLQNLLNLGFQKIRILNVWSAPLGVKEYHTYIVAFNPYNLGDWLNAGYSPSYTEYTNALVNGVGNYCICFSWN